MTNDSLLKVEISLKRVQTFIFDVPRLRAMLGANVLVGETMRNTLTQLAIVCKAIRVPAADVPAADPHDPLQPTVSLDRDDPSALYEKGVLIRDGGHFAAVFENMDSANAFRSEAETKLSSELPGVLFDIYPPRLLGNDPLEPEERGLEAREAQILDLPVLQVCQETGREVASEAIYRAEDEKVWAAQSVKVRMKAGQRFPNGSHDIIGLMGEALGLTEKSGWTVPEDLKDLCAGQYLALIHADGNGVGLRYKEWKQGSADTKEAQALSPLDREARGEQFYHSMRVAVRKALVQALNLTFKERQGVRPYEVLMPGGDDLFIACRADRALPFAVAYTSALKKLPLKDGKPLDVGMGVAIAKESYPLHRLHELAESLAGSAKRRYRADKSSGSVIDWQVVTNSWFDDVAEARRAAD